MSSEPSDGHGFLWGLLVGGLVGTAVGILLAPRSGRELREELFERGLDLKERGLDLSDLDLRGRADELAAAARYRVADVASKGRDVVSGVREGIRESRARPADNVERGA